jgi:hypothetical protein
MSEVRRISLIKPTIQTPYHIDFAWWQKTDNSWRVAMESLLCAEHQHIFADLPEGQMVDWIDSETAEVQPMDGIQHILISHCARQQEFLNEHTALVEAVFRLLLANENKPMSAEELSRRLNRPAEVILKTIAGPRVYRGLRPYAGEIQPL